MYPFGLREQFGGIVFGQEEVVDSCGNPVIDQLYATRKTPCVHVLNAQPFCKLLVLRTKVLHSLFVTDFGE